MNRTFAHLLIMLLAAFAGSARAEAQSGPRIRAITSIGTGGYIRLVARDRGVIEGTLGCTDSTLAFVRAGGSTMLMHVADMDSIWHYDNQREVIYAGAGVLLGVAGGLALVVFSGLGESTERSSITASMVMIFGGGILGGFAGSRLGRDQNQWRLAYPR